MIAVGRKLIHTMAVDPQTTRIRKLEVIIILRVESCEVERTVIVWVAEARYDKGRY